MNDRFPRPLTLREGRYIAQCYPPATPGQGSCIDEIPHPSKWNHPICCTRPARHLDGPHVRHVTKEEADYVWW